MSTLILLLVSLGVQCTISQQPQVEERPFARVGLGYGRIADKRESSVRTVLSPFRGQHADMVKSVALIQAD